MVDTIIIVSFCCILLSFIWEIVEAEDCGCDITPFLVNLTSSTCIFLAFNYLINVKGV